MIGWHYCNNEVFKSIVENRQLWLTPLSQTNDVLEGEVYFRFLKKSAEETCPDAFTKVRALEELRKFYQAYSICFSESGDLLGQWREYGQRGEGFALEFDLKVVANDIFKRVSEDSVSDLEEDKLSIEEVVYTPPGIEDLEILNDLRISCSKPSADKLSMSYRAKDVDCLKALYRFKHPAFQDERERRLFAVCYRGGVGEKRGLQTFRSLENCGGSTKQVIKLPFLNTSLASGEYALKSIKIGPRSNLTCADVESYLAERDLGYLKVTKSDIPLR